MCHQTKTRSDIGLRKETRGDPELVMSFQRKGNKGKTCCGNA